MNRAYFTGLGLHLFGIVLVIALGLALYFTIKRGLKSLLLKKYISQPLYVVAKVGVRWLCIIIVFILVLQQIGVSVSHIATGLLTVAGMVAIGFIAVWSILSNVMSSLLLVAFNVFRIGDEIEVIEPAGSDKGLRGRVIGFNVMYTMVEESPVEGGAPFQVQIPNNIFFQKALRRRPGTATEGLGQYLLSRPLSFPVARKEESR
jgi:small-conductance mechanosensitive channel